MTGPCCVGQWDMVGGDGHDGADTKLNKNIVCGAGISNSALALANGTWLYVMEMMVWIQNSMRILSVVSVERFCVGQWDMVVGDGNDGVDTKLFGNFSSIVLST